MSTSFILTLLFIFNHIPVENIKAEDAVLSSQEAVDIVLNSEYPPLWGGKYYGENLQAGFLDFDFDGILEFIILKGFSDGCRYDVYKIMSNTKTVTEIMYNFAPSDANLEEYFSKIYYNKERGKKGYYGVWRTFYNNDIRFTDTYEENYFCLEYDPIEDDLLHSFGTYDFYTIAHFSDSEDKYYINHPEYSRWTKGEEVSKNKFENYRNELMSNLTDMNLEANFVDISGMNKDEIRDVLIYSYESFHYSEQIISDKDINNEELNIIDNNTVRIFMNDFATWSEAINLYDRLSSSDTCEVGFLDLDFDNNLELIVHRQGGSGRYSYYYFFKINANDEKVEPMEIYYSKDYMDIIPDSLTKLYRNKATGEMAYYGIDVERFDSSNYINRFCSIGFFEEKVIVDYYYSLIYSLDENRNETVKYYNESSNAYMNESEFSVFKDKYMSNLEDMNLKAKFTDIRNMSKEEITSVLLESYDEFDYDRYDWIDISEEIITDEMIQEHIENIRNGDTNIPYAYSSEIIRKVIDYIETDDNLNDYDTLKKISNFKKFGSLTEFSLLIGDHYSEAVDSYKQDFAIELFLTELLCRKETIEGLSESYQIATNELSDAILNMIRKKGITLGLTDVDIEELNTLLHIEDHTSEEFIYAKNKWIEKNNEKIDIIKMIPNLEMLGYGLEISNLDDKNFLDYYTVMLISAGFKASDQYMQGVIDSLALSVKEYYDRTNSTRALYIYKSLEKYSSQYKVKAEDIKWRFLGDALKSSGLQIFSTIASDVSLSIIEDVVTELCPQVAALLEAVGAVDTLFNLNLIVCDKLTNIGDALLEKETFLNLLVLQDSMCMSLNDSSGDAFLASKLINNKNAESLQQYHMGYYVYKSLCDLSLVHGKRYLQHVMGNYFERIDRRITAAELASEIESERVSVSLLKCKSCFSPSLDYNPSMYYDYNSYCVACPVNIVITDDKGNSVILNEENETILREMGVIFDIFYLEEEDYPSKFFMMPNNFKYEIEAYDNGKMNVSEMIVANGIVEKYNSVTECEIVGNTTYSVITDNDSAILLNETNNLTVTDLNTIILDKAGDVNLDGKVNAIDIIDMKEYLFDLTTLTKTQTSLSDINNDEVINIIDFILLQKCIINS